MWNGPRGKDLFQTRHHAGTVQSYVRPLSAVWAAGLDEVRDARGLSHLRAVSAVRKTACLASGFRPLGIIVCLCTSPLTAILRRSASLDQRRSRVCDASCCFHNSIRPTLRQKRPDDPRHLTGERNGDDLIGSSCQDCVLLPRACRRTEVAPSTSRERSSALPIFDILPKRSLPPLERDFGVKPSHAARWRPDLNPAGSGTSALIDAAVIAPHPVLSSAAACPCLALPQQRSPARAYQSAVSVLSNCRQGKANGFRQASIRFVTYNFD